MVGIDDDDEDNYINDQNDHDDHDDNDEYDDKDYNDHDDDDNDNDQVTISNLGHDFPCQPRPSPYFWNSTSCRDSMPSKYIHHHY